MQNDNIFSTNQLKTCTFSVLFHETYIGQFLSKTYIRDIKIEWNLRFWKFVWGLSDFHHIKWKNMKLIFITLNENMKLLKIMGNLKFNNWFSKMIFDFLMENEPYDKMNAIDNFFLCPPWREKNAKKGDSFFFWNLYTIKA